MRGRWNYRLSGIPLRLDVTPQGLTQRKISYCLLQERIKRRRKGEREKLEEDEETKEGGEDGGFSRANKNKEQAG